MSTNKIFFINQINKNIGKDYFIIVCLYDKLLKNNYIIINIIISHNFFSYVNCPSLVGHTYILDTHI
jgi:hypothetical protein